MQLVQHFILGVHPNDCWLCIVPLFHISGFSILMRSVLYGMTVSLHTKFDPEKVVDEILDGAATRMSLVAVIASTYRILFWKIEIVFSRFVSINFSWWRSCSFILFRASD